MEREYSGMAFARREAEPARSVFGRRLITSCKVLRPRAYIWGTHALRRGPGVHQGETLEAEADDPLHKPVSMAHERLCLSYSSSCKSCISSLLASLDLPDEVIYW